MDKNKIRPSKGFRKYLRNEKALINRQFSDITERENKLKEIKDLYKKLIEEKMKIKNKPVEKPKDVLETVDKS